MKKILSLLAAVLFAGSMMADQVTVTASNFTATTESAFSKVIEGVKFSCSTGTVGSELRIFAGQTLTISVGEGGSISKIDFTSTANGSAKYGLGKFAALDGFTYDANATTGSWTGNATEVTFNASAQVRLTQIVVTYVRGTVDPEEDEEGGDDSDLSYDYEPSATTVNIALNYMKYVDYTASDGVVLLVLGDEEDLNEAPNWAELSFNATSFSGSIPAGTYPINDTDAAGTFTSSPGGNDDYDYPSYLGIDAGDGYYDPYYLMSGNVIIAADGSITVNATSYKGSTVTITCTGQEGTVDDEQGIENVVLEDSARKVMVDGAMYIIRDKKMYNAQGAQVK